MRLVTFRKPRRDRGQKRTSKKQHLLRALNLTATGMAVGRAGGLVVGIHQITKPIRQTGKTTRAAIAALENAYHPQAAKLAEQQLRAASAGDFGEMKRLQRERDKLFRQFNTTLKNINQTGNKVVTVAGELARSPEARAALQRKMRMGAVIGAGIGLGGYGLYQGIKTWRNRRKNRRRGTRRLARR